MKLHQVSLSIMVCCAFAAPAAHAGKPKLPDKIVIDAYSVEEFKPLEDGAAAPGAGGATTFTSADLGRLRIVSGGFSGMTAYLNGVVKEIAANGPAPEIVPEVKIFSSQSEEARAISPGLVVVSTGLLSAVGAYDAFVAEQSGDKTNAASDALHFFLAHEYAHILYGHPRRYQETANAENISEPLTQGFQLMTEIEALDARYSGEQAPELQKAKKSYMSAMAASPWIEAELYRSVYAPYVRGEEQMADYMAVDLLKQPKLKTDPRRGAEPIAKFYKNYDASIKAKLNAAAKDVGETMETATKSIVAAMPEQLMSDPDSFESMAKQQLIFYGGAQMMTWLQRRLDKDKVHLYYSAADRLKAIEAYNDHFYGRPEEEEDASLANFGAVVDRSKSEQFTNLLRSEFTPVAAAAQAMEMLAAGDIEGARKALASVECLNCANVEYLMASGDVAFAAGDLTGAIGFYRRVIHSADAPLWSFTALSRAHLRNGNSAKAMEALDLGARRYSEQEVIVQRIEVLLSDDRKEDALAMLEQCRAFNEQALTSACEKAAEPAMPKPEKEDKPNLFSIIPVGDAIDGLMKK